MKDANIVPDEGKQDEIDIDEFSEFVTQSGVKLSSPLATQALMFAATVHVVRNQMDSEYCSSTDDLIYLEKYGLLTSRILTQKCIEDGDAFEGAEVGDKCWDGTYLGHMLDEIVGDYLIKQCANYINLEREQSND